MGLVEKHANDETALNIIFSSIILICKIFRSLNAQDLPEEFENNLEIYMTHFLTLLTYDNPLLQSKTEEAGLLEQLKSQICDNVSLFAQNYGEDFQDYLPKFVTAVWNLLITIGLDTKYDVLVSNAIQFLTAVVYRPQYKSLFDNEESLKSICEKVIIPNLFLRDVDIETFEDNPEEYLRKDIERSDTDTRRRSASELVQSLCIHFEKQVVAIFSSYVQVLLQEYAANPTKNWRQKDVVLFLVTTLASRGQTKKHGTTKASELIDITQFYTVTVLPDLTDGDVNSFPILKADSMRYIATFRQHLSKDILINAISNLVRFLTSKEPVVHTYSCHAIEKILTVKSTESPKDTLISCNDISAVIPAMIQNILNILQPVTSENEYAMRTLMRLCFAMQDNIQPYVDPIIAKLVVLLEAISKNPCKPNFNHYLFETFGVIIRGVCVKNVEYVGTFEAHLFPIFNIILTNDITEFIPYAFQLLSLMLELNKDSLISDSYHQLFPFLLMPVLWERPGYVPALTRLLQAYIERGGKTIVSEKITAVLGIFQRLIASKLNDHFAFNILNSLIQYLPQDVLATYIKQIFFLLFQRLTSSKTTKFVKNMLVFLSLYSWKYSPNSLADLIDAIQSGMFMMVMEKLYAPDLQKVTGNLDRKICAVGLVKILTECNILLTNEANLKVWISLMDALVGLYELPEDTAASEEEHFVDTEDIGYQASFNQLLSANKKDADPFNGEITNTKHFLAKKLESMSSQMPGRIGQLVNQMDPKSQQYLQKYIQDAQVSIQ
jgi:exportin-2 (importin alpha re-exporter)